jgi:ketosteroid isomerase-like protein
MGYKSALEKYILATNTHDFANVEKLLDENAVYWFSDKTCVNSEEIKSYFNNSWKMIQEEVYEAENIQWIAVDSNSATCLYTYKWRGYYKGELTSGSGRATNVFVRNSEGVWKLIHEHLSSN